MDGCVNGMEEKTGGKGDARKNTRHCTDVEEGDVG